MGIGDFLKAAVGAVPGGSAVKAAAAVLGRFVSTPEDKRALAEITDRAADRESEERKGQIEVNKVEAQHRTVFVAGWRPYIGWVLGTGTGALYFVLIWKVLVAEPIPDLSPLTPFFTMLGTMLGINMALRSRDKRLGTSR